MPGHQYKTLAELQEAYGNGTLQEDDGEQLWIDNDRAYVYSKAEDKVFEISTGDLLHQALNLLGIPHDTP